MKVKVIRKDFDINNFIKESYSVYNALKNRIVLTEADMANIDFNTFPNYLKNIANKLNNKFSVENLNKIEDTLNNTIKKLDLIAKVKEANEDLKKHYTRQASNKPEDLNASMNDYFDKVTNLTPKNNVGLTKFIEKLRKEVFSSKKLSKYTKDTGELLQSDIFDKIEHSILGAVKTPSGTDNLDDIKKLCNDTQESLNNLKNISEYFMKNINITSLLMDLANKIEVDKKNNNETRLKSWQSSLKHILASLNKLSKSAELDLSASSLKLLKRNIEEATQSLASIQKAGTIKKLANQLKKATDSHNKEIDNTIDKEGEILNDVDDIDWAERLKAATSSGDSKKDMAGSEAFWNEYYKTEWQEKAKAISELGGLFREELISLGFTKDTNPFIKFVEDNISLLNINNYPAFHNAFINRYVSKNMLNHSHDNNIGHILSCENLYDQSASDILKYLNYQHKILLKYDNNSLGFTDQRLTDLFSSADNENAFIYSIFVAKADPTSAQIVPSGLSARINDENTPDEDKQKFVNAIIKKLNNEPLTDKNLSTVSNIAIKFERCFGEIEKKITVTNDQISKISKELRNGLDTASAIKYLATIYNVPMDTILKYPKIAENKLLDVSKNKQYAMIFKPFDIKQSNVQAIITGLAKEVGWEK